MTFSTIFKKVGDMDISGVLSILHESLPIGLLAICVIMAQMKRDIKHINEKLDNHVTDTNKKIDLLREDTRHAHNEIKSTLEAIRRS